MAWRVDGLKWWLGRQAGVGPERAARMKRAAGRQVDQVGRRAGNRGDVAELAGHARDRAQQAERVWMARSIEEVVDLASSTTGRRTS